MRKTAREGSIDTFTSAPFAHSGFTYDVYRKGSGPAVIVIAEMPGMSPQVLGFADHVVDLGCTAVLPNLFGEAGRDPLVGNPFEVVGNFARTFAGACISREFTAFATGKTTPVVAFLRGLANEEHRRCGGPGVGVVGMCFTGGFALGMAVEPSVIAPVLSQPSLPLPITKAHAGSINCSDADLSVVAGRCAREGLDVYGLRFLGDPVVSDARFAFLRERLGDRFVAIEIDKSHGHPKNPLRKPHSVLTFDLVDEPGEPTREALDRVLALFRTKLLGAPARDVATV